MKTITAHLKNNYISTVKDNKAARKSSIKKTDDDYDIVRVKTSPSMIVHWAMQYADRVEIMDDDIRLKIREEIESLEKKYV